MSSKSFSAAKKDSFSIDVFSIIFTFDIPADERVWNAPTITIDTTSTHISISIIEKADILLYESIIFYLKIYGTTYHQENEKSYIYLVYSKNFLATDIQKNV